MSSYQAPIADMLFAMRELAGYDAVAALPGFEDASVDVVEAVLDEAATFASDVLDPLNVTGDRVGATWKDGVVTMPAGFKEAYAQFGKAGWVGLPMPAEFGGQGLPRHPRYWCRPMIELIYPKGARSGPRRGSNR